MASPCLSNVRAGSDLCEYKQHGGRLGIHLKMLNFSLLSASRYAAAHHFCSVLHAVFIFFFCLFNKIDVGLPECSLSTGPLTSSLLNYRTFTDLMFHLVSGWH